MSHLDPYRCKHAILDTIPINKYKVELRCKFCKELIGWWENSQENNIYNIADEERQHLV